MSSVLLAHSYFLRLDPKQHAKMKPYPPLNTLHAATVLRTDGHDVALFDAMLAADEHEFRSSLELHRPSVVVLFEDNFNFLSKMCLTRMREAALTMIGMAREAGCRVAVCGADVTDHAEVYLSAGAEVCLLGEGEHSMREVVGRWLGPDPQHSPTSPAWRCCTMGSCTRMAADPSNAIPMCSACRRATSSTWTPTARPGCSTTGASR
jgi:anaerobic magnesium-protoporphyrin IX monomethyl ester cyclase